jgi:hypothetical protein
LKQFPNRCYRKEFADSLDKLLEKSKKNELEEKQQSNRIGDKKKYQSLISRCKIS